MSANRTNGAEAPVALVNGRVIDPAAQIDAPGGVLIAGRRIVAAGPDIRTDTIPAEARVIDVGGAVIAPGLVDMRAALGEPGHEHKETLATASRAALAGGITAIACLPNTIPPLDDAPAIEFIARRARENKGVKVFPYATVTRGAEGRDLTEIGLLREAGAVAFTDGTRAVADPLVMRRALAYAKGFGALIVQHPEEPRLSPSGVMNAGEIATRIGLSGIAPQAEVMMIERDLRLVEMTGARYHAAHISTAESVRVIAAAKARGLPVTCDTAPPYFALTEVDVGDYKTFARLSPPLRRFEDRIAIAEGVADGTIDAVASDHQPQDEDAKRLPFAHAAPGMIGLETLLAITLQLHHQNDMPLPAIVRRLSTDPAAILGLPTGNLSPGTPADITVFDPDSPWKIEADRLKSKSRNTLFDGRPVMGRAIMTVVDGRILHEEGLCS